MPNEFHINQAEAGLIADDCQAAADSCMNSAGNLPLHSPERRGMQDAATRWTQVATAFREGHTIVIDPA